MAALQQNRNQAAERPFLVLRCILAAGVILATLLRLPVCGDLIRRRRQDGYGYTGRAWRDSETLRSARSLPVNLTIYSNAPDLLAFYGRPARSLPAAYSPTSLAPNSQLGRQLGELQTALNHGARIVCFRESPRQYLISSDTIERKLPGLSLRRFADGAIYDFDAPAPPRRR